MAVKRFPGTRGDPRPGQRNGEALATERWLDDLGRARGRQHQPRIAGQTVSGTAGAAPGSALGVSRASNAIGPGGSDAVSGSLVATPAILTYVLTDNGTAAETTIGTPALGSLSNCTATLTTTPGGSLAVGASTSLAITVTPIAAGSWSFTVSVADSDSTNNPYTWTVGGMATVATSSGSSSGSSSGCGHGSALSMMMLSVLGTGLLVMLRRRP